MSRNREHEKSFLYRMGPVCATGFLLLHRRRGCPLSQSLACFTAVKTLQVAVYQAGTPFSFIRLDPKTGNILRVEYFVAIRVGFAYRSCLCSGSVGLTRQQIATRPR